MSAASDLVFGARAGEVEADLQRFYGLHVGLFPGPRLSARRLLVLAAHLPSDAAMHRQGPWGLREQLAAAAVDELRWANYATRQRNDKRTVAVPEPLPRPGVARRERIGNSSADLLAALDKLGGRDRG